VVKNILADDRQHATSEDIRQAIQQRTTRGMLTFNMRLLSLVRNAVCG
jgi:hypothetical protein